MKDGYNSIVGLNALKALNITQEDLDYTKEEIDQNIRTLKSRLNSPITDMTDADVSLYDALLRNIDDLVDVSKLTWKDPIANTVLSDDSEVIENLGKRQRRTFLEPREKMKCKLPNLVSLKCNEFANNFHKISTLDEFKDIRHNGLWKEEESDLGKITEQILSILEIMWNNPAFETSMSRNM
ncbi:hypothetical protein F8M41_016228 [Gigaspora margarita]|uniref:Uncharacterized protein n=1 Tax=Gigaspora margarita TaxID=4874 RepID=A0A8H4EMQ7_GIGMA|nr:hypothetical protein F8M41_016228 [Gigaspora margarita]